VKAKRVAILEARAGEQMADLVRKYGGTPISAPGLSELPDIDPQQITGLLSQWASELPHLFIFQTGVGVRALLAATDELGLSDRLLQILAASQVAVRGPKPLAALRSRGVRIDFAAQEPYTTTEVLAELVNNNLAGKRVVVQRYGETNRELHEALEKKGAQVIEIATYRWALPADTAPLAHLVNALGRKEIDAVAFTSASQVHNLFTVAKTLGREDSLRAGLDSALIASIGPVCSAALRQHEVRVDVESHPPKLGPFMRALNDALSER